MPVINTNLDELLYLQNCDLLWNDESLFIQKTAEFQGLKLLFQRESPYSMRLLLKKVKRKVKKIIIFIMLLCLQNQEFWLL
jgi:hypothetical protein